MIGKFVLVVESADGDGGSDDLTEGYRVNDNEAREIMEKASKRAATDPKFRIKLLSNPNAAVQEFAGKPIPPNIKVRVLEIKGMTLLCSSRIR